MGGSWGRLARRSLTLSLVFCTPSLPLATRSPTHSLARPPTTLYVLTCRRDLAEGAEPALQRLPSARPLSQEEAAALAVVNVWGAESSSPATPQGDSSTAASSSSSSGSSDGGGSSGSEHAAGASPSDRVHSGHGASTSGRLAGAIDAATAAAGAAQLLPLQEPEMRQAIAWQLCLRQLHRHHSEAAIQLLKEESGAHAVKDLQVRMQVGFGGAKCFICLGVLSAPKCIFAEGAHPMPYT